MSANEWLGVMKQASDFPQGMEKLILKYGEMLIAEHEGKVKKLTIPDVSFAKRKVCSIGVDYEECSEHPLNELGCSTCEKYIEQT